MTVLKLYPGPWNNPVINSLRKSKISDELKSKLFGEESEHSDQMSEIMELVLDGDVSRSEGLIYAMMQNKDQELIVLKVNYLPVKNVAKIVDDF